MANSEKEDLKHIKYTDILTKTYSPQLKKYVILKKGTFDYHIKKGHPEIVSENQISEAIKFPLYITSEINGRYDIISSDWNRSRNDMKLKFIKVPIEMAYFGEKDGTEVIGYDVCTATYAKPHFKIEDAIYDYKNESNEE